MTPDQMRALIRDVPDFPKPGIMFKDITPLLCAPSALAAVTAHFTARFLGQGITKIIAPESRGFMFGAPLAVALQAGFVPVRKPKKLPPPVAGITYDLEYGQDRLEIRDDALSASDRVLLVDDVLATGGTAAAVIRLAQQQGATVIGAAFLMDLAFLDGAQKLAPTPIFSLLTYG